jgi:hypothetical protein
MSEEDFKPARVPSESEIVDDIAKAHEMAKAGKPDRDQLAKVHSYPDDREAFLFGVDGGLPTRRATWGEPLYQKRIMPEELKSMAAHYENSADLAESRAEIKYDVESLVKGMDNDKLKEEADKVANEVQIAETELMEIRQKTEGDWSEDAHSKRKLAEDKYFSLLYKNSCFERIIESRKG